MQNLATVKILPSSQSAFHYMEHLAPQICSAWINRCASKHTQRAYRKDVEAFVRWMGWEWPEQAGSLLRVGVSDIQRWRQAMLDRSLAPMTIHRRISSLSSLYRYFAGCAAEMRIPLVVANPAHAQFVARIVPEARIETRALTSDQAQLLMSLPQGESLEALRDRALLRVFLFTGLRLGAACRLLVEDLNLTEGESWLRLREKGQRVRVIGLHMEAATALRQYVEGAGLRMGPLFRPFRSRKRHELAAWAMGAVTMYKTLQRYLGRLPGALQPVNGERAGKCRCIYTPHSLRATTATLLLEAGVEITKVQQLLGHRHITTTQIYDKRRIAVTQSASHQVPL